MGINYNEDQLSSESGFTYRFIPAAPSDTSHVTLLLLHGTGGDENDLIDLGRMVLPGAAILSPRGKVLEGRSWRFFRRISEGVFDVKDLRERTTELAKFIKAASTAYDFDAQRVVAVGFSNGANIAGSMLLQYPDILAAAALLSPMVPFEPEQLPNLAGKPVFVGRGNYDPIAQPDNSGRLVELLKQTGANVTDFTFNGGHTITREELRAAQAWIKGLSF